jgi:Uma2 family endonuclease
MTTAIRSTSLSEIDYPEDDGQPMAESTLQFKWIVVIKEGLEGLFRDDPNVFVAGDLLWYPVKGDPTIRTAPDAMAVFGRPKKGRRGSYKQWEEGNITPQVVFEVLSPGNRAGELERKFAFYERYGVEEYYLYDPDDGFLQGWLRTSEGLRKVHKMAGFVSPLLGIRFEPGEGPDNLAIIGPDGARFLTYTEQIELREAAEQRAEAERQRAEVERQLAEAAAERAAAERERAERLSARLRELGIEPD